MMKPASNSLAAFGLAALFTAAAPVHAQQDPLPESYIELPAAFERAVQGCTIDGYIYRMTYNMAVDMDDIAAIPSADTPNEEMSLFYQLVRRDPEAIIGISGSDTFMAALKTVSRDIHSNMQNVGGLLIDEASSEIIESSSFAELMSDASQRIADSQSERYGIGIAINTDTPVRQGGRCAAVPEAPPPVDPGVPGPR